MRKLICLLIPLVLLFGCQDHTAFVLLVQENNKIVSDVTTGLIEQLDIEMADPNATEHEKQQYALLKEKLIFMQNSSRAIHDWVDLKINNKEMQAKVLQLMYRIKSARGETK